MTLEDAPELAFFPGMDLPRERKLRFAGRFLDAFQENFEVVSMTGHAQRVRERGVARSVKLALSSG